MHTKIAESKKLLKKEYETFDVTKAELVSMLDMITTLAESLEYDYKVVTKRNPPRFVLGEDLHD